MKRLLVPLLLSISLASLCRGEHHMRRKIETRQSSSDSGVYVKVSNLCDETIWPGVVTQHGDNPSATGFELPPQTNRTIQVGADWQGRVWGRTNCSFPSDQSTGTRVPGGCSTGECGSFDCFQAGNPPATLAEFTMNGGQSQSFYDISLVDGYNLPMAIVLIPNAGSTASGSSSNPSCVGSLQGFAAAQGYNPYLGGQTFLGTSASDPLPFENTIDGATVASWCPWDLQYLPPRSPSDGVYPYPETSIQRPFFDPCLSACAKHNSPEYCCTGAHNLPATCGHNYYSKMAKAVCPDAYSYAYDDQDSTFIVPAGDSFEVIFCPGGRSTNILAVASGKSTAKG